MEITSLTQNSLRIKTKQAVLFIDATEERVKGTADGTLLLGTQTVSKFFSEDLGVTLQGAGEYEIKGVKITGFRADQQVMYTISGDNLMVFVGKVSSAAEAKDKLHEHDIAILDADAVISQATMGLLNAQVVIFYGEKAQECAKTIGKDSLSPVGKYAVTKDKLPSETEVVILG